jgi:2-oxoglutarate dehydrogenase E2 component (dihydrolipoamide succinyltransferase)
MTTQQHVGTAVRMPSLGENVEAGLKQPGNRVEIDQALLEDATDKVDAEIRHPWPESSKKSSPRKTMWSPSAMPSQRSPRRRKPLRPKQFRQPTAPPRRRRRTRQRPCQYRSHRTPTCAGTSGGNNDRDAARDRIALGFRTADSATEKLPRIRRTIAQRMMASLQTSAQLTTVLEVDVTHVARLRAAHKTEFFERTGNCTAANGALSQNLRIIRNESMTDSDSCQPIYGAVLAEGEVR